MFDAESPPQDSPKELSLSVGHTRSSKRARPNDAEADGANKAVRYSERICANKAKTVAKNAAASSVDDSSSHPIMLCRPRSRRQCHIIIEVDMDTKVSLGADVDKSDNRSLLIEKVHSEGVVADFNKSCPTIEIVERGDRIVRCNNTWGSSEMISAEIKAQRLLRLYIRTDLPKNADTMGLFGGPCVPTMRSITKREPQDDHTAHTTCVKREPIFEKLAARIRRRSKTTEANANADGWRETQSQTPTEAKPIHTGPIYRDPICIGTYIRPIYRDLYRQGSIYRALYTGPYI